MEKVIAEDIAVIKKPTHSRSVSQYCIGIVFMGNENKTHIFYYC